MADARAVKLFLASVAGGWLLWMGADSPAGRHEPWDADSQLPYLLAQALLGGILGSVEPRRFWRWPLGVLMGQAIGLLHSGLAGPERSVGPLFPLGLIFLLPYTLPACLGAAAAAGYVRARTGGTTHGDGRS